MRDLICLPPNYEQIEWDPTDLDRMQRILEADRHESWGRRIRYDLACRLFGAVAAIILPPDQSYEDAVRELPPKLRKRFEQRVGPWRKWLARVIAPKQPPQTPAYNLLFMNRIVPALARNEKSAAVLRFDTNASSLTLDGEELTDPMLIREWRLFRYSYSDIAVNGELDEGRIYSCEQSVLGQATQGQRIRIEISLKKQGPVEEMTFRILTTDDTNGRGWEKEKDKE